MRHENFYRDQMLEQGYANPTIQDMELFQKIGYRLFNKVSECGFNVAYAERQLNREPVAGSYQRDMIYNQNMVTNLVHRSMCEDEFTTKWLKGFLGGLTEDACMEQFRQAIAFKRLTDIFNGKDQKMLKQ